MKGEHTNRLSKTQAHFRMKEQWHRITIASLKSQSNQIIQQAIGNIGPQQDGHAFDQFP